MGNIRFYYENLWDLYLINSSTNYSSQSIKFPATNVQQRWWVKPWRSNYGDGTSGGHFKISTSNQKLYFNEGGGTLTATIPTGNYTAEGLAVEVETQMEATGAHSYTVEYSHTTLKYKITDDTSTVTLETQTETNAIWITMGFNSGAVGSPHVENPALYERIHTDEYIRIDYDKTKSGNNLISDMCFIVAEGHNIQTTGTVKIQAASGDFESIEFEAGLSRSSVKSRFAYARAANTDLWSYWRLLINDINNLDAYIQIGRIWMSNNYFEPNGYRPGSKWNMNDPSLRNLSDGGQITVIHKAQYRNFDFTFDAIEDIDTLESIFSEMGTSKPFYIWLKDLQTDTFHTVENFVFYVRISKYEPVYHSGKIIRLNISFEEER